MMPSPMDMLAIQNLYAEYNDAIHRGDGAAWAECFLPEGVFSNIFRTVEGREALVSYAADFSKDRSARYLNNNLLIEASAEGATGTCYLMLLQLGKGGAPPDIQVTGIYTDSLVKSGGLWKFATRHVQRDM